MRYGGHQTFFIREGWLYKGLDLLLHNPEKYSDPYVADHLGVGRNMAIAIKHWLLATGLAVKPKNGGKAKDVNLEPSLFGKVIWEKDRYFAEEATWWLLHVNLVNNPDYAATWSWFFNNYLKDRFEKQVAFEALKRWEQLQKGSNLSNSTLDRDILVFLSSYSRSLPSLNRDPEEEIDCPLRDLGLITHYKSAGYYQVHRIKRQINPGVLLYTLNLNHKIQYSDSSSEMVEKKFSDLSLEPLAPSKVFILSGEDLIEVFSEAERQTDSRLFRWRFLAGERHIQYARFQNSIDILQNYVYCSYSETLGE